MHLPLEFFFLPVNTCEDQDFHNVVIQARLMYSFSMSTTTKTKNKTENQGKCSKFSKGQIYWQASQMLRVEIPALGNWVLKWYFLKSSGEFFSIGLPFYSMGLIAAQALFSRHVLLVHWILQFV
jgi:hypothetical protein